MYLPFLMYGYAGTLLVVLVGLRIVDRSIPGLRGIRMLIATIVCGLATVVLAAARPWAPTFLSIVVANAAYLAAQILIYRAVALVLNVPARWLKLGILVASLGIGAMGWFTYTSPSLLNRILISSGIVMLVNASTAGMLFQNRDPGLRYAIKGLAWLFAGVAAIHLVRCALSMFSRPLDFIHADMVQAAFTYANMVVALATIVGTLWLSSCMQRRELHRMAHTDMLTGLMNRRGFEAALEEALARCKLSGTAAAVMMIDIDHFKQINDDWGHGVGDQVLEQFSAELQTAIRTTDIAARWGGEEFAVLLQETDSDEAEQIAERVRAAIATSPDFPGRMSLTASIGLAMSLRGESLLDFLHRCDSALYISKRTGRNVVTVHGQLECDDPAKMA